MKASRRLTAIAAREVRRLVAAVEQLAVRKPDRREKPSFRPLSRSEAATILGGNVL